MRNWAVVASIGALTMASASLAACTNSDDPTRTPEATATVTVPASDNASPGPSVPIASSQAAGIPTAEPLPATTPDSTTLNASVLITLATVDADTGGLVLGGYVNGVAEDGGDCQYVVAPASGDSLTIHKDGVENNGSTSCGSTTVSPSRVPGGSYTVILRYVNDIGEAESDAVKVTVP